MTQLTSDVALVQEYDYSYTQGGGIYAESGSAVSVERCTFEDNGSSAIYITG